MPTSLRTATPRFVDDVGEVTPWRDPAPDEAHRARLAVCARADDVDEARDLLAMLGLLPDTAALEASLTRRMAALNAEGWTARQIAARLGVTEDDVRRWRRNTGRTGAGPTSTWRQG